MDCRHRRLGALSRARKHKLGLLAGKVTGKAPAYLTGAVNRQIAPRIAIGTCTKPFMLANKIVEVVTHGRGSAALGPAGRTIAKTRLYTPFAPRT